MTVTPDICMPEEKLLDNNESEQKQLKEQLTVDLRRAVDESTCLKDTVQAEHLVMSRVVIPSFRRA